MNSTIHHPNDRRQMLPRDRLRVAADWVAGALLLSLPWSTSATSFLVVVWLLVVVLTLEPQQIKEGLAAPAALLPVALWILAFLGMFWAQTSWSEKLDGLRAFHKLLFIPLLMFHFSRSKNGSKVLGAFLVSTLALLAYSWASLVWPGLVFGGRAPGVPVKDYIYQSMFFVISLCALLHLAITFQQNGRRAYAVLCALLIPVLLANLAYAATSRTALVALIPLVALAGYQRYGVRGAGAIIAGLLIFGAIVWSTSPYLQTRIVEAVEGAGGHGKPVSCELLVVVCEHAPTSESMRIGFWRRSMTSIGEAPIIGHGTGSIHSELEKAQVGTIGTIVITNPHNQVFAIGIQLGAVGIAILLLMWLSHFLMFRGEGLVAWLGTLVVVQNVIASTFNSHISDFTAGWTYVLGVGILGGMMLRERGDIELGERVTRASENAARKLALAFLRRHTASF